MISTIQHPGPNLLRIGEEHGIEPEYHALESEEECQVTASGTPTRGHYPPLPIRVEWLKWLSPNL